MCKSFLCDLTGVFRFFYSLNPNILTFKKEVLLFNIESIIILGFFFTFFIIVTKYT